MGLVRDDPWPGTVCIETICYTAPYYKMYCDYSNSSVIHRVEINALNLEERNPFSINWGFV